MINKTLRHKFHPYSILDSKESMNLCSGVLGVKWINFDKKVRNFTKLLTFSPLKKLMRTSVMNKSNAILPGTILGIIKKLIDPMHIMPKVGK